MTEHRQHAAVGGRGFFYGWTMVGVAGLGIFASGPGQSHTFSVFVGPISQDLGVSSAALATAYGLATLIAAFLLPAVGRLVDTLGARRMMGGVIVLLGLACMFFGAAANYLWLAVGFGLLRFLGQGSLMLGCANLVSQWFSRKRGVAMSLMALGFGASMAFHPPVSQFLIETYGWRTAWFALGGLTWLLMLPPILFMVVNKPEDMGLTPDGEAAPVDEAGEKQAIDGLTLAEALKEPTFYILSAGWFALAMLVTTLHFFQAELLAAQGVAADVAARMFTVSAVAMVACMPLIGRLLDRAPTRFVFAGGLLVMATSLVAVTQATSLGSAVAYALCFGLNNAVTMTMFGYLWPRYFGRKHIGSIQGTGQMIGVVGASLGPLPVGLAFDLVGDARMTLWVMAIIPVACAVLALGLKTPKGVRGQDHLE